MVADEKPPDGRPEERRDSFADPHLLPAACAQQPSGDGRGTGHGQRLAKQPVGIGARVRNGNTSSPAAPASREKRRFRRRQEKNFRRMPRCLTTRNFGPRCNWPEAEHGRGALFSEKIYRSLKPGERRRQIPLSKNSSGFSTKTYSTRLNSRQFRRSTSDLPVADA